MVDGSINAEAAMSRSSSTHPRPQTDTTPTKAPIPLHLRLPYATVCLLDTPPTTTPVPAAPTPSRLSAPPTATAIVAFRGWPSGLGGGRPARQELSLAGPSGRSAREVADVTGAHAVRGRGSGAPRRGAHSQPARSSRRDGSPRRLVGHHSAASVPATSVPVVSGGRHAPPRLSRHDRCRRG